MYFYRISFIESAYKSKNSPNEKTNKINQNAYHGDYEYYNGNVNLLFRMDRYVVAYGVYFK